MANKKLNLDELKSLRVEYYNGTSVVMLAEKFGVSTPSIYNYLKDSPKRNHRKLTPTDVVLILSESPELSTRGIAKKYNVSHETIRRIRKGGK